MTALAVAGFWSLSFAAWWYLALAPLSGATPEVILRTREICFGTLSSGVPDLQGLLMLSAPVPVGIAMWLLWGGQLRRQRPWQLAVVAALPLVTMVWGTARLEQGLRAQQAARQSGPTLGPLPIDYPRLDRPLPALELTDQCGRPFKAERFVGRVTILTFAFRHCQTVCPALLQTAASLPPVPLVVITLDPWRDTCSSLPAASRDWELPDSALIVSGEVEAVNRALDALQVTRERDAVTGDISHPALVYVIDSQARLAYAFLNPSVEWLAEAVRRLEHEQRP